jgi:signal transduction histidine kinase
MDPVPSDPAGRPAIAWERLLDALPSAVNVKDRQGRWLYANPAMLDAFAITGDYRGRRDQEQVPPEHFHHPALEYCERTDQDAWAQGGITRSLERIPDPHGRIAPFEVTKVVVPGATPADDRLLVVGHPAGERIRQEQAAAEMRPDAELGRLVPGMVHDLNNLLTVILGNAELAARGRDGEELRRIVLAAELARTLVGTVLGVARGHSGRHRTVDLAVLVRDLCRLAWHRGDDRSLEVRVPPAPVPSACDQALLGRALLNLLVNARQWTPAGGRVAVTLTVAGGVAELAVDDSGPGIPAADRDRVFAAGFSRREDGSGLGLAVVADCASAHGGACRMEASPLGGCRAVLRLPLAAAAPGPAPEARRPGPLTILVAEPDEAVAAVVRGVLSPDHRVVAADPNDPGRAADAGADLALIDLDLPYRDGLALVTALRRAGWQRPVLLSVANPGDLRLRDGLPAGVEILPKPFAPADLLRAVARAAARNR